MTNKDLLLLVQKLCHVDQTHCSVFLNTLCRLMAQAGVEQVPVTLHGLGTFTSHKHPEYIQEDPSNGRQTLYPPRITYRMQAEEIEESQDNILVQQLADTAKLPQSEATSFVEALVRTIVSKLEEGEEVEVHGLGSFRVVASRQGDIQRTAFTPDEQMKSAVNAPFSCFEPVVIKPANEESVPVVEEEEPIVDSSIIEPSDNEEPDSPSIPGDSLVIEEPIAQDVVNEVPAVPVAETLAEPEKNDEESPVDTDSEVEPIAQNAAAEPKDEITDQKKDEDSQRTHLINLLTVLLVIAIGALCWFIFQLEPEPVEAEVVDEQTELIAENDYEAGASSEVFFGEMNETADSVAEEINAAEEISSEANVSDGQSTAAVVEEKPLANTTADMGSNKPAETKPNNETTVDNQSIETKAPVQTPTVDTQAQSASYGRLKNADGSYATHTLEKGGRLTLVALEHYGDKFFWPYIFEVNKDKLKNPSLVQPGMVLYLPDPKVFGIDANDPESVSKAKAKARQYLQ